MAAAGLPFRVVMSAMRSYLGTVKEKKNGEGVHTAPPSGVVENKEGSKEATEGACPKRPNARRRRGGNRDARQARRLERVLRESSPAPELVAVAPAASPAKAEPSGRVHPAHALEEEIKSVAPEQVPPADIPGILDAAGVKAAKARRAKAAKLNDTQWCMACREKSRHRGGGQPGPLEARRHAGWCTVNREHRVKPGEGNANL